ncbi:hypothetical protein BYT27DRAFT_6625031 [Phlegmacium glaucopus]|nr:hypothetical protein BYT27DRAFT_6625031 [Phlegmacium glaucopus]
MVYTQVWRSKLVFLELCGLSIHVRRNPLIDRQQSHNIAEEYHSCHQLQQISTDVDARISLAYIR